MRFIHLFTKTLTPLLNYSSLPFSSKAAPLLSLTSLDRHDGLVSIHHPLQTSRHAIYHHLRQGVHGHGQRARRRGRTDLPRRTARHAGRFDDERLIAEFLRDAPLRVGLAFETGGGRVFFVLNESKVEDV